MMLALILMPLGMLTTLILLGHLRLLQRQDDVAAARRQIEALTLRLKAEAPQSEGRTRLRRHLAATHTIYTRDLARYHATRGAQINRWKPKALPEDIE